MLALLCAVLAAEELGEALLLGQPEREELAELLALSLGLLLPEALAVSLPLPRLAVAEAERVRCPALERLALTVACRLLAELLEGEPEELPVEQLLREKLPEELTEPPAVVDWEAEALPLPEALAQPEEEGEDTRLPGPGRDLVGLLELLGLRERTEQAL